MFRHMVNSIRRIGSNRQFRVRFTPQSREGVQLRNRLTENIGGKTALSGVLRSRLSPSEFSLIVLRGVHRRVFGRRIRAWRRNTNYVFRRAESVRPCRTVGHAARIAADVDNGVAAPLQTFFPSFEAQAPKEFRMEESKIDQAGMGRLVKALLSIHRTG